MIRLHYIRLTKLGPDTLLMSLRHDAAMLEKLTGELWTASRTQGWPLANSQHRAVGYPVTGLPSANNLNEPGGRSSPLELSAENVPQPSP